MSSNFSHPKFHCEILHYVLFYQSLVLRFFENSVTFLLSSFFSRSTLLKQCSSPKSSLVICPYALLLVFFLSISSLQNLLRLYFLKSFRTLFPGEVLENFHLEVFFLYCSFIFLNYFYTLSNSVLTNNAQKKYQFVFSEPFNLCGFQHFLLQLVHVEELYRPVCQHLLLEVRKNWKIVLIYEVME